ncbi:MAG: hypothetical protein WCA37_14295, partial [Terracidiphilus sp.]
MKGLLQKSVAILLSILLVLMPGVPASAQAPAQTEAAEKPLTLHQYLQKPYLDLFGVAPLLKFSAAEVDRERQALASGKESCRSSFKEHSKSY